MPWFKEVLLEKIWMYRVCCIPALPVAIVIWCKTIMMEWLFVEGMELQIFLLYLHVHKWEEICDMLSYESGRFHTDRPDLVTSVLVCFL